MGGHDDLGGEGGGTCGPHQNFNTPSLIKYLIKLLLVHVGRSEMPFSIATTSGWPWVTIIHVPLCLVLLMSKM